MSGEHKTPADQLRETSEGSDIRRQVDQQARAAADRVRGDFRAAHREHKDEIKEILTLNK